MNCMAKIATTRFFISFYLRKICFGILVNIVISCRLNLFRPSLLYFSRLFLLMSMQNEKRLRQRILSQILPKYLHIPEHF